MGDIKNSPEEAMRIYLDGLSRELGDVARFLESCHVRDVREAEAGDPESADLVAWDPQANERVLVEIWHFPDSEHMATPTDEDRDRWTHDLKAWSEGHDGERARQELVILTHCNECQPERFTVVECS